MSTQEQFHLYILVQSSVSNDKYLPGKLQCLSKDRFPYFLVYSFYKEFVILGSLVLLVACSHSFIKLFLVLMLPWGFLNTEVPITEPSGIKEVWHQAPEIPELGVASPLLHYDLIKPLKHRCGFCMLMVLNSLEYTHRDFFCSKRGMGALVFVCVCQDVYISTNIRRLQLIILRDPATRGGVKSHAALGCGKRPQPCDVACPYTNLIPNSPSEFNFDTTEIQFVQEKWREEVITSVTRICYFLNKPRTEEMCLNFLLYCENSCRGTHWAAVEGAIPAIGANIMW